MRQRQTFHKRGPYRSTHQNILRVLRRAGDFAEFLNSPRDDHRIAGDWVTDRPGAAEIAHGPRTVCRPIRIRNVVPPFSDCLRLSSIIARENGGAFYRHPTRHGVALSMDYLATVASRGCRSASNKYQIQSEAVGQHPH
jgi:hypothetical protein